jgi:hypothetical protein
MSNVTTTTTTNELSQAVKNLLKIDEIQSVINALNSNESLFNTQLNQCNLFLISSDNYSEAKLIDKEYFKQFEDKYKFFEFKFQYKKTQTSMYIKIGKIIKADLEIVKVEDRKVELFKAYAKKNNISIVITEFDKWLTSEKTPQTNTTKTSVTDTSKTNKPLAFKSEKNGIEIKVLAKLTKEEKMKAIAWLEALETISEETETETPEA